MKVTECHITLSSATLDDKTRQTDTSTNINRIPRSTGWGVLL